MPLIGHIRELRRRLIVSLIAGMVAAIGSFLGYRYILAFIYRPFELIGSGAQGTVLYVNTLTEGFLVKIKVSVLSGIVLSLPVHLYNIARFVFPGLSPKERKVVGISMFASFLLAGSSLFYAYYQILPVMIKFLTSAGFIPEQVGMLLGFSKNISYIFRFLLVTLLIFQFPIVVEVLLALNLLKRRALLKASRFVIVGIFVLAAVLTPSIDFVSQLALALPMVVLFFLTILVARLFNLGGE